MSRERRGRGEGSIYRRKDGTWSAIVSLGVVHAEGEPPRRIRKQIYGESKGEVQQKMLALRANHNPTAAAASRHRTTTGEWLDAWLETHVKKSVRPTTYDLYESQVRLYIKPYIGNIPLDKLAPTHLRQHYTMLEEKKRSPRLCQCVHLRLHRALRVAQRQGLVLQNVATLVDPPKATYKRFETYDEDEVRALLTAARGDRYEALYVLAVTTGMRQGELFALRWSDVDLSSGSLSVRGTLTYDADGHRVVGDPKTKSSRRRIDIGPSVVALLRRTKPGNARGSDFVFTTPTGEPLEKNNFVRRQFHPLVRKAELKVLRFHDLRHTAATLMLGRGVHPKIVQERLGHASIAITLDTYSHAVPGMQREVASELDRLLV